MACSQFARGLSLEKLRHNAVPRAGSTLSWRSNGSGSITHSIALGSPVVGLHSRTRQRHIKETQHQGAVRDSDQVGKREGKMLNLKTGLEFQDLAIGLERNFSCSYLINLDYDLMNLIMPERNFIDIARDVLIGHTKRIFHQINLRSKRSITQFCFGSTHLQLNPNSRRLDRMDPATWKKDGICSTWSGLRGLRKPCCKVCCSDLQCGGCRECLCRQGPIRGQYDGLVVLTCLTRQSLPSSHLAKMDQEDLAVALEHSLTVHIMQEDSDLGRTIVHTGRDRFTPEQQIKKHPAYCVYVAYRLDRYTDGLASQVGSFTDMSDVEEDEEGYDEDTIEVMEELEDKELVSRLAALEEENQSLREIVAKLETNRGWLEGRVEALENTITTTNLSTGELEKSEK